MPYCLKVLAKTGLNLAHYSDSRAPISRLTGGFLACSMMDPPGTTHAAASPAPSQVLEANYAFAPVQDSFSILMYVGYTSESVAASS